MHVLVDERTEPQWYAANERLVDLRSSGYVELCVT
jgi:hypothetical protein